MAPFLSNGNGHTGSGGSVGIFSRTVIRSPVVHWILHARIRDKSLNDAVLVGSDFVHVRQVGHQGLLEHIATKDDFDAQIRAATVFRLDPDPLGEDFLVKVEDEKTPRLGSVPPDLLVLTLSTNDLIFLYLEMQGNGTLRFVHQALPLPIFDRVLFQPGEHLAVDPRSRALAVAANEREVVIYSAKARERVVEQIRGGDRDWCPVVAERALQIDGIIQHMDFLIPPDDEEDHIVLLLIVVDRQRTKAMWIDWYGATGLRRVEMHPGEPLSSARTVSSLLIPLQQAAFLLVTGKEIRKYYGILSGSIIGSAFNPGLDDHGEDGNSPLQPLWASWCKPHRHTSTGEKDHIYLVREDGLVLYIYATHDGPVMNGPAGHLDCHVGTAFASLGQTTGPDILAAAGEMSAGRVVSIGLWNGARLDHLGWEDTMKMDLIQTIPNWASSTDMITSSSVYSHSKMVPSRDSVFVTSGRQPHGSVTELRHGLEARAWAHVPLKDMHVVTAMWAVPMALNGSLLLIMSTPSTTMAFELDADSNMIEHGGQTLDLKSRTLTAAATTDGRIVQVTEDGIVETLTLVANFEDTARRRCAPGDSINAAVVDNIHDLLVTAECRRGDQVLCFAQLGPSSGSSPSAIHTLPLPSAALALAIVPGSVKNLVAVATAGDGVMIVASDGGSASQVSQLTLPSMRDTSSLCDHLAVLRSDATSNVLVVCGLRDGRLFTAVLDGEDGNFCEPRDVHTLRFGQSTIRVVAMAGRPSEACMMAGLYTCLLAWDGLSASSLSVHSVWFSDKHRPELAQGPALACAHVPPSDSLAAQDHAGSLALVSGDELLLTYLSSTPDVVPRQLPVNGTPSRLLYAEQQKCLVVAGLQTGLRAFPTPSAPPEQRRQLWPTIDFIPSRASEPSFTHELQPGEKINALLEWSYKRDEKTYSFIIVGGSYRRHDGSLGGRVTFLQPSLASWEVTGVRTEKVTRFDAPVYALALYDGLTYAICYGLNVCLFRFSPKERKWEELCPPLALSSRGVAITVDAPLIYVSTNEDSLNTLQLRSEPDEEGTPSSRLFLVASGPQAHSAMSHAIVQSRREHTSDDPTKTALISTMNRWVVGLSSRSAADSAKTRPIADELQFKALLPRSLTRIRQSSVRPPWKTLPPDGVLVDDIVGVASDGSLVGLALVDEHLWRRLSWLQRLCEWSELLSPHACQIPLYTAAEESYARHERPLPVGIREAHGDESEIMLRTSVDAPADKHIDGDVLMRLLERGGADTLRKIIREIAARSDHAGTWTREHLDEELAAVDEVVALLKALLAGWL